MRGFVTFSPTTGKICDLDREFPTYLSAWDGQALSVETGTDTHFGYVHRGTAELVSEGRCFPVYQGMYFSVPGAFSVQGGTGVVISRERFRGVFALGGPVEPCGRLRYIDGSTDSLLIPPARFGDPCLNALYFTANIDQTSHTHPSDRVGMILSGRGECVVEEQGRAKVWPLMPGMIFAIRAHTLHKFRTPHDCGLTVLAYHPESDFGPRDNDHPMINRTFIEGVSAARLGGLRDSEL